MARQLDGLGVGFGVDGAVPLDGVDDGDAESVEGFAGASAGLSALAAFLYESLR